MTESLFANQNILQTLAEINAKLQARVQVAPDNQQSHPLSASMDRPLAETTQNLVQQLTGLSTNLLNMRERAHWGERVSLTRGLNSRARQDTDLLFALPLPEGGYPAEGVFPETVGEFMSLEGPALATLLLLYGLPHQDQVADARNTLARHFSILL